MEKAGLSEEELAGIRDTEPEFLTSFETAAALREYNMYRRGDGRYGGDDPDTGIYTPQEPPFSASYIGRLIDHAADMLSMPRSEPFNDEAYDL